MSYHFVIPLFAAFASISLGVLVHKKTAPSHLNRVFLFLSATLVLWNLHFFALYWFEDKNLAFRVARIFRVGSIFLQPAILHLLVALKSPRSERWSKILRLDYLAAALLTIANFFDL